MVISFYFRDIWKEKNTKIKQIQMSNTKSIRVEAITNSNTDTHL
jgi:hypothetical protein